MKNLRPSDYETDALPTALTRLETISIILFNVCFAIKIKTHNRLNFEIFILFSNSCCSVVWIVVCDDVLMSVMCGVRVWALPPFTSTETMSIQFAYISKICFGLVKIKRADKGTLKLLTA